MGKPGIIRLFLVVVVLLFGTAVRLVHLAFVDTSLPFRYGGLFVEFSQRLAANHYLLPQRVPFYTDGGIPFAYPPLPFYVEAVLLDVFSLPKFSVATLLPPAIAVLSVPSFYLLTRELGLSFRTRLAALVAFAGMPVAFREQIDGAGLSEAFGTLALLWLAISLVRAHNKETAGSYGLVGLFWAICLVSSPGSAYASIPTMLIFALVQFARAEWRPSARIIGLLGVAVAIAGAASSPYWLTVIANHGVMIFVDTVVDQHEARLPAPWMIITEFPEIQDFVSGAPAPFFFPARSRYLWDVAILGGVVWALFRRQWALLVWFVVLFSIPREGRWLAAIPAALLAGIGIAAAFGPFLVRPGQSYLRKVGQVAIVGGSALLLGMYVIFIPIVTIRDMVTVLYRGPSYDAVAGMEWAMENTPAESKFIVLAHEQVKEWTPQVARRTVLNITYGAEWEPEELKRINWLEVLLNACADFDCIQAAVTEMMGYDEVYLYAERGRLSRLRSGSRTKFELMWENSEVAIGRLISTSGEPR